jgi:predicted anti-sigma-YlaC factor YlaD
MTGKPISGVSITEKKMKHQRIQKRLSRKFDRGLPLSDRLQKHLAQCPECRRFWEDLTILESAISEMQSIAAPGDMTASVLAAIRRSEPARRFVLRPVWAAAFAVILALAGGIWYGSSLEAYQVKENQATIAEAFSESAPGSLWNFETNQNNSQ